MNGPSNNQHHQQQQQQPQMQNEFGPRVPHQPQFTAPLARKRADFTPEEKTQITGDLKKYLAPEFTSRRSGPGGNQLTYIEAWRVKNMANSLFGFDGWSSTIADVTVDFLDVSNDGKVSVGVSVITRVTLKDGTTHEDIGYGNSENLKSKAASFEKASWILLRVKFRSAKKEAASDSLKRAMTSFGNLFTCLYDKNYCRFVGQQKVDKQKFDAENVYRYPEDMAKRQQQHQQQQPQPQPHPPQQQQQQTNWQGMLTLGTIKTEPFRPAVGAPQNLTTLGASTGTSFSNLAQNQVAQNQDVQNQFAPNNGPQNGLQNGLQNFPQRNEVSHDDGKPFGRCGRTNTIDEFTTDCDSFDDFDDDDTLFVGLPDDLFVGADIEDAKIFQAESPRFSDLDFDFTADMIQDDSPEKPRAEPPALVRTSYVPSTPENARSKSGSGSFSRTVSSPSLVQTTPTKASSSTNGGDSVKNVPPPQYKGNLAAKPNPFAPSTASTSSSGRTSNQGGAGHTGGGQVNGRSSTPNPNSSSNQWKPQGQTTSMQRAPVNQPNVNALRANSAAANPPKTSNPIPNTTGQGNGSFPDLSSANGVSTSSNSGIKGSTPGIVHPNTRLTSTTPSNGFAKGPTSTTISNQDFNTRLVGQNSNTASGSTNTTEMNSGASSNALIPTSTVQNGAMQPHRQTPSLITPPSFTNHPNTNLGLKRPLMTEM
ncbi:DNA repair protein rad52 [Podila minutissima]|nr:DNA repair protein rad52 [Podila minutissima]